MEYFTSIPGSPSLPDRPGSPIVPCQHIWITTPPDRAIVTWGWAVIHLWSDGARFAHGAGDTLVWKHREKTLILLDTPCWSWFYVRYVREAPSVQESLSLQDLPRCPVNTSAMEIKNQKKNKNVQHSLLNRTFWPREPSSSVIIFGHRRMLLWSENISLFMEMADGCTAQPHPYFSPH